MFRSATFKLTVYYLAIVVLISLIFSAVVYRVGTNDLAFGLNRQTQRITNDFPIFDNSPYLRPGAYLSNGTRRLLDRLVAFNVIVFIGAGFASYGLARRTLRPIEAAHEQQKRFTADVSHELRTPLTALKMESEVALIDPKAPKDSLREALRSNIEEAAKLDVLINNLLRLTRLEAGELQQGFESLSSLNVVNEALAQVQKIADSRRIKLTADVSDFSLPGDRDSLAQLLVILLDNAVKYSPNGGEVRLSAKSQDRSALFKVHDNGIGIEKAALDHVFDRFYRADSSRTKADSEGYGLGLSIAKLIADVHGGQITLSSRPGHGTTASFSLPLKPS